MVAKVHGRFKPDARGVGLAGAYRGGTRNYKKKPPQAMMLTRVTLR